MADQQSRLKVINDNPIGKGLDAFRTSFTSICEGAAVSCTADALEQLDQETSRTSFAPFLREAQNLPAADLLPAKTGRGTLREDLLRLELSLRSDDFDLDGIKPLLILALDGHPNDTLIWEYLYNAVIETTPAPRPIASYLQQTLSLRTTSSLVNSSEYHNNINSVLKSELDHVYIDIRHFNEAYFGGVTSLEVASKTVFKKCVDGSNPLFGSEGWSELPAGAEEKHVLAWFGDLIPKLEAFAGDYNSTSIPRRMLLAQPNTPLLGSRGKRSMDIGFVKDDFTHDPTAGKDFRYHWSHVLVLGELKSNPSADKPSIAMISIATCAREVLSAQDTRRFVFGFTLCGSYMRIYAFDRLGGIGSGKFDINKEGQQFVSTILGFLWMNEEELGFDLTFMTANGQRFIMIKRNGSTERLVINELMQRTRCINPQNPLVIKDSWQWPERDEEGDLLREATGKGVVKVARYYHHETVQVNGMDDDIRSNIRKGLDITGATNYGTGWSVVSPSTSAAGNPRKGQSSSAAGTKRSSSQAGAPLLPSKRSGLASAIKAGSDLLLNRVHRRVILRDYGKPIYKASSRAALLAALEACIEGHESLYIASLLHRDISINNLIINEDENNPSSPSFLIDLDLSPSEAFMAIGAFQGESHSFMHDLESFFWVLFWTCIHYNAQGKDIGSTVFESWNYQNDHIPVQSKKGEIADEEDFIKSVAEIFTLHYQPLIPWVNRLRRKVFPDGKRWKRLEPELYSSMKQILYDARKDPEVLADSLGSLQF
ncbi:serine/threonine-protein kinase Sgk2 [Lasiosphaeria miniovina]|uniref:non-specific serine/threonine protein kinase n=1 Tax=Lasiosphaeria miniovina TaxID=1954250 RepID=A0AA40AUF5_9PEZI|nr:serine/threonine-protein kinase Sgk2 [Lasiosphaeria miniovina]KAK0722221.1 serine/threonine-protein kinase Sgk2 [Lasiosphaeria miniovina]